METNHCFRQCSEQNQQVNESGMEQNLVLGDALEARVQSLKQTIFALKSELLEEKALWRKEIELMTSLISASERRSDSEPASEGEAEGKSTASAPTALPDPSAASPSVRDYEEKLSRYQGALAQAQAERRLNIRRQIAANTYRKRLNEVEKLCQEELDKVRETATYLEPLKQIASEWGKTKQQQQQQQQQQQCSEPEGKSRKRSSSSLECGGDFFSAKDGDSASYDVPLKQIDASLVVDEDASSEIKGKIVLQLGSLPTEVPTICYSAKFE